MKPKSIERRLIVLAIIRQVRASLYGFFFWFVFFCGFYPETILQEVNFLKK